MEVEGIAVKEHTLSVQIGGNTTTGLSSGLMDTNIKRSLRNSNPDHRHLFREAAILLVISIPLWNPAAFVFAVLSLKNILAYRHKARAS